MHIDIERKGVAVVNVTEITEPSAGVTLIHKYTIDDALYLNNLSRDRAMAQSQILRLEAVIVAIDDAIAKLSIL